MNKYLRAIIYNFLYFILSAVFFLAVTPIAIRVMGEDLYGLWIVLSSLMLFLNIGNFGIDAIVLKLSSEACLPDEKQVQWDRIRTSGFLVALLMSMLASVLLICFRNFIVHEINTTQKYSIQLGQAVFWIAAGILPQFLTRVPYGFLLSQLHNQKVRQIEFLSTCSLWIGALVISLIDKNLATITVWSFFNSWLVFGLFFQSSQQVMPFHPRFDAYTLKRVINFSKFMFLENLAISLFQQLDKVVVGFVLGPALAGNYSIGTSVALRLSMVTGQATEVMVPYASLRESLNDQSILYSVFRRLSRYVSLFLAMMSSLLIIWMHDFLRVWISLDFAGRYAFDFQILVLAYSLISLSRPAHQTLTGMGKIKFTSLVYLLSTIGMFVGLFSLSKWMGIRGAVISNLFLALLLIFNLYIYFRLGNSDPWKAYFYDLHLGLFLPVIFFVINLFLFPGILSMKLSESLFLGIMFVWVIAHDDSHMIATGLVKIKQIILRS